MRTGIHRNIFYIALSRREYEQPIPVTPTSPPGWGEDIGESIRWRRGELLGSGAYGNVYLGLNLDTGELMADYEEHQRTAELEKHQLLRQ